MSENYSKTLMDITGPQIRMAMISKSKALKMLGLAGFVADKALAASPMAGNETFLKAVKAVQAYADGEGTIEEVAAVIPAVDEIVKAEHNKPTGNGAVVTLIAFLVTAANGLPDQRLRMGCLLNVGATISMSGPMTIKEYAPEQAQAIIEEIIVKAKEIYP